MCAIIGAKIVRADMGVRGSLQRVFQESRIRGLYSFGCAIYNKKKTMCYYCDMQTMMKIIWDMDDNSLFIGHCRYPTSGLNPQPLFIDGIAFAFNGNIHMGDKHTLEQVFKTKLTTDNDGEVFIRKVLLGGENPVKFISNPAISFAGVWIQKEGELHVLRNDRRPAYMSKDVRGNVIIASTKDIFKRAMPGAHSKAIMSDYEVII